MEKCFLPKPWVDFSNPQLKQPWTSFSISPEHAPAFESDDGKRLLKEDRAKIVQEKSISALILRIEWDNFLAELALTSLTTGKEEDREIPEGSFLICWNSIILNC